MIAKCHGVEQEEMNMTQIDATVSKVALIY
jgi:hypothetical protein